VPGLVASLRHPARRRSGSILSPGTHTGSMTVINSLCIVLLCYVFSTSIDLVSLQLLLCCRVTVCRDYVIHSNKEINYTSVDIAVL